MPESKPLAVEAITYKPHWRFAERSGAAGCCYETVLWGVPDARHPERAVNVSSYAFGRDEDEAAALRSIFRSILELEVHEAAEWFTYRGERVFDPHTQVLPFAVVETG